MSDGCRLTAPVSLERNQREGPGLPGSDACFYSCFFFFSQPVPHHRLSFYSFSSRRSVSIKQDTSRNQQIGREPLAARPPPQRDAASCGARIWRRGRERGCQLARRLIRGLALIFPVLRFDLAQFLERLTHSFKATNLV